MMVTPAARLADCFLVTTHIPWSNSGRVEVLCYHFPEEKGRHNMQRRRTRLVDLLDLCGPIGGPWPL